MCGKQMWKSGFIGLSLLCLIPGHLCIDPFTSGLGVGLGLLGSAIWSSREILLCQFKECCKEPYVRTNLVGFKENLDNNLFGQHIVKDTILKTLTSHLRKKDPKKALALSFHGWTGSGKTYVSKFIAETMFQEGMKSKYVHLLVSTIHFPNELDADKYKTDLQSWIRGNVSTCDRSLFIFDEIDKLAPGVIDGIKPFLDFHTEVDGVNYRKSVFVFLSNTGGEDISDLTLEHWKTGRAREELTVHNFSDILSRAAFNEIGGLQKADVIQKDLIDLSIPFLPLERSHVKMCIRRELNERLEKSKLEQERLPPEQRRELKTFTDEDISDMADKRKYWPLSYKVFSTSGCKKIDILVDEFLDGDW